MSYCPVSEVIRDDLLNVAVPVREFRSRDTSVALDKLEKVLIHATGKETS